MCIRDSSKRILFDRLENCVIHADVIAERVEFVVEPMTPLLPGINNQGYIVLDDSQI